MSGSTTGRTGAGAPSTPPRPPRTLKKSGKALWNSVVSEYELDVHEMSLLLQACRCADRLDRLDEYLEAQDVIDETDRGDLIAHPALVEARQQSAILMRLIASLRLPSGDEGDRPQRRGAARAAYTPRTIRAVQ